MFFSSFSFVFFPVLNPLFFSAAPITAIRSSCVSAGLKNIATTLGTLETRGGGFTWIHCLADAKVVLIYGSIEG